MATENLVESMRSTYHDIYKNIGYEESDFQRFMHKLEQSKHLRSEQLKKEITEILNGINLKI